jgi:hypothetical protein
MPCQIVLHAYSLEKQEFSATGHFRAPPGNLQFWQRLPIMAGERDEF